MKVNSKKVEDELGLANFVDVKGWKAIGNKVSDQRLTGITEIEDEPEARPKKKKEVKGTEKTESKLKAGDSIEFDVKKNGQGKLFD